MASRSESPSRAALRRRKSRALHRRGFRCSDPVPVNGDGYTYLISHGHLRDGYDHTSAEVANAIARLLIDLADKEI